MPISTGPFDLDEKIYGRLLQEALAHVIRTEDEYERFTSELLRLDELDEPTREQEELGELLTVLIDEYEERRYPIRKASPQQTLQHLMEARGLTQKDLRKVFGSKGITSEVSRQAIRQQSAGKKTRGILPRKRRSLHLTAATG